jgi:hypothetical protein
MAAFAPVTRITDNDNSCVWLWTMLFNDPPCVGAASGGTDVEAPGSLSAQARACTYFAETATLGQLRLFSIENSGVMTVTSNP